MAGISVSPWHVRPTIHTDDGAINAWNDGDRLGVDFWVTMHKDPAGIISSPLYIQLGALLVYPSGYSTYVYGDVDAMAPNTTVQQSFSMLLGAGHGTPVLDQDGIYTVYGLIDCLDVDGNGCSSPAGSQRNVIVTDPVQFSVTHGPYDPYDLWITHSGNVLKFDWKDNLGGTGKSADEVHIYVNGVHITAGMQSGTHCEAGYDISPGNQIQYTVQTHGTNGRSSNVVWSGIYTIPRNIRPTRFFQHSINIY